MVDPERERRLRRRYGPPAADAGPDRRPPRPGRRRWERPLTIAWLSILALGLLVKLFLVLTPGDRVARGCWWWTSPDVTRVAAGYEGCVHGYVVPAGGLAESRDPSSIALSLDPGERSCGFAPGQAVVVRARAIFSDGRTYLLVRDCG